MANYSASGEAVAVASGSAVAVASGSAVAVASGSAVAVASGVSAISFITLSIRVAASARVALALGWNEPSV